MLGAQVPEKDKNHGETGVMVAHMASRATSWPLTFADVIQVQKGRGIHFGGPPVESRKIASRSHLT